MPDQDNPYAAPRSALEPAATAPLPANVRRYRLDSARAATLVRRRLRLFGIAVLVGLTPLVPGMLSPSASRLTNSLTAIVIGGLAAVGIVRIRYVARRALPAFDLLVAPRVVRRVAAGLPPAEVLRPEVTSIVESGQGLWLCSERPARALLVPKALEGYDGLRAELATWAPLHSMGTAWSALRRPWQLLSQHGLRDEIAGTALEADASLAHELDAVRRASSDAWREFPQPNSRRFLVVLAVWVTLVVLLFAVSEVLQPSPPRRPTVEDVR
jgi:hypothetical protein